MACQGLGCRVCMGLVIGTAVWCMVGSQEAVGAAQQETRVFSVKIDGKKAGLLRMTIRQPDAHTFTVESSADVAVSFFLKKYQYMYRGTEVWKDGRLVRLESQTNDDGNQFQVLVQPDGDKLRVRVNGSEHMTRPDVWTTTYWYLQERQSPDSSVVLIDCDTGKDLFGTMRLVSTQQLTVAGQTQNCAHYQIRGGGGLQVDLWYDAQKRLVRQKSLDDGHDVVLELMRLDR